MQSPNPSYGTATTVGKAQRGRRLVLHGERCLPALPRYARAMPCAGPACGKDLAAAPEDIHVYPTAAGMTFRCPACHAAGAAAGGAR